MISAVKYVLFRHRRPMKAIKTVENRCSVPRPSCIGPPGCRSAAGNMPAAPPPSPGGISVGLSSVAGGSHGNLWGHPQTHSMSWWWMAQGTTAYALDALWMKMHAACSQLPHGTKINEHDAQDGCNNYTECVRTAQVVAPVINNSKRLQKKYVCLQENCFLILYLYMIRATADTTCKQPKLSSIKIFLLKNLILIIVECACVFVPPWSRDGLQGGLSSSMKERKLFFAQWKIDDRSASMTNQPPLPHFFIDRYL